MSVRSPISQWELANPLYKGATVAFYTVANGVKTSTLATLYAATTGTAQLANPQKLNSRGQFKQPVYIADQVIGVISGISVPGHDTGIISPAPTFRVQQSTGKLQFSYDGGSTYSDSGDYIFFHRGAWVTGAVYNRNDTVTESSAVYLCITAHTAGVFATDLAASKWVLVGAIDVSVSGGSALVGFIQAGVGAVARTAQEDMRELIKVTQFMSASQKSDVLAFAYLVDVTDAYQKALDYADSVGGKVIVPGGGYLISDTLNPANGLMIDGMGANTIHKFGAANKPCFKLGTNDAGFNYGNALRDMYFMLTEKTSDGIKINAGINMHLLNIGMEGWQADYLTRTNRGVDIDGRNISSFHNVLQNVRLVNFHEGVVVRTTGTTSPTAQKFIGVITSGNYAAGDTGSHGINFINAGESTVMIGCETSDASVGLYIQGGASGPGLSYFGHYFENNQYDIKNDSTSGGLTLLGSKNLDPAKVIDNSGRTDNVIQYGVAGTVGVSGLVVPANYTRINGSGDYDFTATISGPTAAGTRQCHVSVHGKMVTLTMPKFNDAGASSATPFTITGLPAALYPASEVLQSMVNTIDNGADVSGACRIRITTAGGITVFANSTGGSFTSGVSNTGFYGWTITYRAA